MASEADEVAKAHGATHAHAGACLNCGAIRAGPYCQDCGQSGHVHRHAVAIGHDLLHGVFHFEGKLGATLPLLLWCPGELTRRYVAGERARFVSPVALFLFSVFLLFTAVNRVAMPDVAGVGQGVARVQDEVRNGLARTRAEVATLAARRRDLLARDPNADTRALDAEIEKARHEAASLGRAETELPRWIGPERDPSGEAARGLHDAAGAAVEQVPPNAIGQEIAHVRDNPELYLYKLKIASYKYSWALIPISIPFIWLLFAWRRDVGVYDHAIFAIHSLAFMTLLAVALIVLALLGVPAWLLWIGALAVPPVHMYRQLKGAYRLRRWAALWRTAALLVATSVSSTVFFVFLLWLELE